ncbi:MAG: metal-binding protein, partial [Pirellulales bacterium]|nr:metal-binding protein [Pirellulales bacterium]
MQVDYQYHGHSRMASTAGGKQIRFAANLARDIVSFDGELRYPLRFREAISALHDVVVADLRHQPRDKTAYMDWKAQEQKRLNAIREATFQAEVIRHEEARQEPNAELLRKHQSGVKEYWRARRRLQTQLARENLSLWQRLFPLDPVVTVADDVVFFEVFSQDESSYGCLTCQRDECFASTDDVSPGTTNIDYSWDLYDHFQTLRSYRQTRLTIDPTGVTAETGDERGVRMEKIDLPASWLSGFLQVQAAMTLAKVSVSLSRDAVYSLLAWLKRHRARQSPRAIRFELTPDQPVRLVLEPWDQVIESHGTPYAGSEPQSIRVWGRRRLLTLARLLPLMTSVDVYLLGTGLPSVWVVRLGEMRFTLGLSGW